MPRSAAADRPGPDSPCDISRWPAGVRIWVRPPVQLSGVSKPPEPARPIPEAITSARVRSAESADRTSSACSRAYTKKLSAASIKADARRRGQRDPDTQRKAHHEVSRYPAPRTVSIDCVPNGRSIFSRRIRTYTSTMFESPSPRSPRHAQGISAREITWAG